MEQGPRRYAAFLSYSHKDAAAARALHRRLESYRIPRRLVGSDGERGPVPARLTPIFRDREELPAAGDLSETVRAALAVSDVLVILCSPAAAASPWVAKEIDTFRALHPGRPIIAAILDGEPGEAFPPALCTGGIEPLAADLRPGRDGRRLGFLKLVAGLSGVGLDSLVQRDAQRRLRRVTAVTGAALAAVVAMAVLTAVALQARAEAQRQRAEAEGLVEFMLTDLRTQLKGAAGLRVLTAASRRALAYYEQQPLRDLSAVSLERRARILHAIGEDKLAAGDITGAARLFDQAAASTSQLLRQASHDPQRIYAHAQSEFWIGNVAFRQKRFHAAWAAFSRYKALADDLVLKDSISRSWQAEPAYADGNLCSVALEWNRLDFALAKCTSSLVRMRWAARGSTDLNLWSAVANRYGWLADTYRKRGDAARAWQTRVQQERLLNRLLLSSPNNLDLTELWLTNQFSTAEIEIEAGRRKSAEQRLQRALLTATDLTRRDPLNKNWASRERRIREDLNALEISTN